MIQESLTTAEQAFDDRIRNIQNRAGLEVQGLYRQLRIQKIVLGIVGGIIAIETITTGVLRICGGL